MKSKKAGLASRSRLQCPQGSTNISPQETEVGLRRLGRREWWLWSYAMVVMLLSTVAFVLLSFPPLFHPTDLFFPIHPDQGARGLLSLLLLFTICFVYRQWLLRRQRKRLTQQSSGATDLQGQTEDVCGLSELDPLTGLYNRRFAEQRLAKEIACARRQSQPLTLLILDLDNFKQLNDRFGKAAGDLVLQEFAKRLKKATRGSDLAVRLGADEFLLVLPECGLGAVQHVLGRVNPMEMKYRGQKLSVTCSAAWVDYQPGELPGELLQRADQVLGLYKKAGQECLSAALATN